MKRPAFAIWSIVLISAAAVLLATVPAFASVNALTVEGLPPGAVVVLTSDAEPKVKIEGQAGQLGTFKFELGKYNLPAGSDVKITVDGRESKIIPSLADGSSTRDFRNPDRGAYQPPDDGWSVSLQVGYGRRQTGQATSGTFLLTDKVIVSSPEWVSGVSPMLTANGPLLGKDLYIGVRGFFGNGRNSENVPVGGDPIGISFDEAGISTGIAVGATGARTSSKVNVKDLEFNFALPNLFYEFDKDKFELKIGPRLVAGHNRNDYEARFQSSSFSGISSTRDRDVKQTYGGPGITVQKTVQLLDHVEFYAGINVDALYSTTDYDGRQHTVCDLLGCVLAGVSDVRIKTSDRHSGWAVRPSVSVGLEYEFNSSSVGLNANYEYWHKRAVLDDRDNPLDDPPGLKKKGLHGFGVGLFYQYKF